MKRLIIALFLVVSLLTTSSVQIFAEEPEYSNTESIEELYNAYLNNHDVTDRVELTPEENNELSGLIQSYKEKTLHSYPSPISRTRLNDFTGGIFIHYDSATGSWQHGHAAIGRGLGTVEIMNPNSTVKVYDESRIKEWYKKPSGGFFTVKGANGTHNTNASNYAANEVGTGYWLIGDTGEWGGYTCSYLVAYAWNKAGFYIGGRLVTPSGLENSANTILQFRWADVSY